MIASNLQKLKQQTAVISVLKRLAWSSYQPNILETELSSDTTKTKNPKLITTKFNETINWS